MEIVSLLPGASGNQTGNMLDTGLPQSSCTLQVTVSGGSGGSPSFSVQLQGSADGITWVSVGSAVTTASTAALFPSPAARCFRAILSGFTGPGKVTVKLGYAEPSGSAVPSRSTGVPGGYTVTGAGWSGSDFGPTLQAAMNAVGTAGGGVVLVAPGVYPVTTVVNAVSKVTVRGCGAATQFYQTTSSYVFANASTGALNDIGFEDFLITGTVNQTVTVPTIARTTSGAGTVRGIYISGSLDTSNPGMPVVTNVTIRNVMVRNVTQAPILVAGITGKTIITGCEFTNTKDSGMIFCQEVIYIGNHSYMSADNGHSLSRGCQKVTCVGNTTEMCANDGIWLAGFAGTTGPQQFTCTGNTVKNVGRIGINLQDAPAYGVVSGNFIDMNYNRGPSDVPDDSTACGILVRGSSTSPGSPSTYCQDILVTGNTIRRAATAGIIADGVIACKITSNLICDTGTQYLANGSTVIASGGTIQNIGVLLAYPSTCTDLEVSNNTIVDERTASGGTSYTNYGITAVNNAVQPLLPFNPGGIYGTNNSGSGWRNTVNLFPGAQPYDLPYSADPQTVSSVQAVLAASSAYYAKAQGGYRYISSIVIDVAIQSGNIDVGVYSNSANSGTGAQPVTRLANAGSTACPAAGVATVNLTSSVFVSPNTNWLAFAIDNATATIGRVLGYGLGGMTLRQASIGVPLPSTASSLVTTGTNVFMVGV